MPGGTPGSAVLLLMKRSLADASAALRLPDPWHGARMVNMPKITPLGQKSALKCWLMNFVQVMLGHEICLVHEILHDPDNLRRYS